MVVNTIDELINLLNQVDVDATVLAAISNDAFDATENGPGPGLVTTRNGAVVKNVQKVLFDIETGISESVRPAVYEEGVEVILNPAILNFVGETVTVTDVGGVATITIDDEGGDVKQVGTPAINEIAYWAGEEFLAGSSSFVWINTNERLQITGETPNIRFLDTDTSGSHDISAADELLSFSADPGNGQAGSGIQFLVDGSEVVRITDQGFLGIGRTPTATIDVEAANPAIVLRDTDAASNGYAIINAGAVGQLFLNADQTDTEAGSYIALLVDNTEHMRVNSNGNVGIGLTDPSDLIHIADSDNPGLRIEDTDLSGAHARFSITPIGAGARIEADPDNTEASSTIQFYIDGTEQFRMSDTLELRMPAVTVADLVTAAGAGAGARAFVTDATATTFASVVAGGGANGVPVYSDGTDWRIG